MVLVASKEPPRLVQGSPPGDLRLRIVGTARDGQIIRLTAAKCSVGSGENCTLRLRARGVRAVHCLILRGASGTVARAWAPNTRLNGQPFSDALLEPGDRLSIGPVEFEILAPEGPPPDPTDAGRTVVLDRRPAKGEWPGRRSQDPTAHPAKRPRRWQARVRRLVGEVRKLREDIDRFERAAPQVNQQAAEAAELQLRLERVRQQNDAWEAALERLQKELDERQAQLANELATIERARGEFAADQRTWQAAHDAQQQAIAEREAAHLRAEEQRHRAQEAWNREREQQEAELAAEHETLNYRREEIQRQAGAEEELKEQRADLEQRSAEFAARETEYEARYQELVARENDLATSQAELRRAEEELAACRGAFEAQQSAALQELDLARQAVAAAEADSLATQRKLECQSSSLLAAQEDCQQQAERYAGLEADLCAAREALAALHETEQLSIRERSSELDRLEAELAQRERAPATLAASAKTIVAEPPTELVAELASLRQQLADRDASEANAVSEREQALASREAAAEEASAELAARESEFQTRCATQEQQLAERQAELAALESAYRDQMSQHHAATSELELAREELEHRARQLREREEELADQVAEATSASEPAPQTLPAETPDLSAERAELTAAQARLATELADLQSEREALQLEREAFAQERLRAAERLDAEARELAAARQQLDAERDDWDARAERPRSWRSTESVYEKRADDEQADNEPEDERPQTFPSETFNEFSPQRRGSDAFGGETERMPVTETLRSPNAGDDEDSMESHIAAFMDRLRGGQSAPPAVPQEIAPNRRKTDKPPEQPKPVSPAAESSVMDLPSGPVEMTRRRAPEEKNSMNVLREIGLTHARSAIDTHGQRRSLNQAYGTLGISAACLAVAFFVLYMAGNATMRSAGILILVIGIYWMGTSIWAANKVVATIRRRRRGGLRAVLEEVEAELAVAEQERAAASDPVPAE